MIRILDILLALVSLSALAPLFVVVMVILRFTGEGEVFYSQERIGRGGRIFLLWKFATMLKESPRLPGGMLTLHNDPRVLPVGKMLRKAKINELPQLLNILAGDMSFVGPRPQTKAHFDLFPDHVKEGIADISPGLTGVGSIVFRDEESLLAQHGGDPAVLHDKVITPYKGELELWFARNRSAWLYGAILFLTAWVVVFPKSRLHLRVLKGLPEPPEVLQRLGVVHRHS
jgi:lipopolysaccharide/colanic/teichoic acid biosynthesis glycosyltransferase